MMMTDRSGDEIVVSFPYSSRQHTNALERTVGMRLLYTFVTGLAVIYAGDTIYEWIQGEPVLSTGGMWSLLKDLVITSGILMPFWLIRITRTQTGSDDTPQTFRFNEKGFALSEGVPLTPWGLMDRVNEVKGAFLLKDSLSKWPVYMPTTSISSEDLARLRNIIRSEFLLRPKNVKLLG